MVFNLKKEWFDKIKSGEKTHEYRLATPYWDKRLRIIKNWVDYLKENGVERHNWVFSNRMITFALGYPKKDDKNRVLKATIK